MALYEFDLCALLHLALLLPQQSCSLLCVMESYIYILLAFILIKYLRDVGLHLGIMIEFWNECQSHHGS